ncbi:transcription termination factor 2-like [Scaptodrosophila lebanonensis]|uniref:Transcription termination factor 2-like n=1 Tax=Drosophila lebanonensis TaxID=7225 RepID=A0A6J2T738_DROLE|nr:transcription termination factor 2-like [Scaptodrosophila lebanonensis]
MDLPSLENVSDANLSGLKVPLMDLPSLENVSDADLSGIKVPLMDHQKTALAWMKRREEQKPHGGILADDMGLGKTISAISLVLASKNRNTNTFNGVTLVICPASLLRQWECEVKSKVSHEKLNIFVHHGRNRGRPEVLCTFDIVITTYGIAMREYKHSGNLFGVKWKRIILDEAHLVRNSKTITCEAVCELRSNYRWALTGTPIQNEKLDLYALIKFLHYTPYGNLAEWKKRIENNKTDGQQKLKRLLEPLMLRRTKDQLKDIDKNRVPNKFYKPIMFELDAEEEEVYDKIDRFKKYILNEEINIDGEYYKMHEKFKDMEKGNAKHVLLLRLQQICCLPGLIVEMLDESDDEEENTGSVVPCIENNLERQSSKMLKLMKTLAPIMNKSRDKVIIVSKWKSALNILSNHLQKAKWPTLSLNGSTKLKDRRSIVNKFNDPENPNRILLLSLKAGGLGLNLVGASHMLFFDIHWNPQLDLQAEGRIYRIGQKKDVIIHKFMCSNTIEESIFKVQKRKLEIAEGVLTVSNDIDTIEDILL